MKLEYSNSDRFVISLCLIIIGLLSIILKDVVGTLVSNPDSNTWILFLIIIVFILFCIVFGFTSFRNWRRDENLERKIKEAQLGNKSLILEKILEFKLSKNEAFNQKRLEKLDEIWASIRKAKEYPPIGYTITYYEILRPEEYNTPKTNELIPNTNQKELHDVHGNISTLIRNNRFYISNRLYYLVFYYQAFLGRIVFFATRNRNAMKIPDWSKDDGTIRLMKEIFKVLEKTHPKNVQARQLGAILEYTESEISQEIKKILSGESDEDIPLQKIIEWNNIINETKVPIE